MTGHYTHAAGTTYTCIDSHPDTLHGGATSKGVGYMFYMVEAACDSLTWREENLCVLSVLENKT